MHIHGFAVDSELNGSMRINFYTVIPYTGGVALGGAVYGPNDGIHWSEGTVIDGVAFD